MIDDSTVARLLSPGEVLGVIGEAFGGGLLIPPRAVAAHRSAVGAAPAALLAMPALRPEGIGIVKAVRAIGGPAGGLDSHLLAFDEGGALIAIIEAHHLTALRTAAVSVLAAQHAGVSGVRRLAVLGAGRQARAHVKAFAAAMPLASVAIWARRSEASAELVDELQGEASEVRCAATVDEALNGADLVSSLVPTATPLLRSAMIADGVHVDLVGGFRPDMREVDDDLIARARVIADCPTALHEAGDLAGPLAARRIRSGDITLLGDLVARRRVLKPACVTLFKSVGHAGEDLVAAELLLRRADLLGAARENPRPQAACDA